MKRAPVAEIGDEDYRIVRHTHDVAEAETLMRAALGDHGEIGCCESEDCHTTGCTNVVKLGEPRQVYVRIIHALPGSWQREDMGWTFEYRECSKGRGAFPAVVFT